MGKMGSRSCSRRHHARFRNGGGRARHKHGHQQTQQQEKQEQEKQEYQRALDNARGRLDFRELLLHLADERLLLLHLRQQDRRQLVIPDALDLSLVVAVYDGDPAGAGFSDEQQIRNPAGVNFRLRDPPLLMGEAQFRHDHVMPGDGRSGAIKIGGWRHFGRFPDQRFGADRRSLNDPASNETPLSHNGNFGVYILADQWLWRAAERPSAGIGAFSRVIASPNDRNAISFYADAGLEFRGIWNARSNDTFGAAIAYTRVSSELSALDRDKAFFAPIPASSASPVRSSEIAFEANYRFAVAEGWYVQPDVQFIVRPGAGKPDPRDPSGARIRDALAVGVRSLVRF